MLVAVSRILFTLALGLAAGSTVLAQCPASVPAQGATPPGPLPLFPATNWWNLDISAAPVDAGSAGYISFVNNGGTQRLHPDFGGEVSPGSVAIYGMPYAVVDGTQPKQAVTFHYWRESDGVDYATSQGIPFYPIPAQAITQPHWVEGGAPANVDQRTSADRHLLMIDCTNKHLYELYNVYFNSTQGKWYAGSGAFFDMNANNRRPDTWTSADAAGLAIFPGLVRYDEAWNPAVTDIGHALRVTVRATNGYVYPGSHDAGSTADALPMGARLRLKTNVNGTDPALRTSDPNARKIFRAMQRYGLIVADNGTDLYVTGTFDTRWNNDILNPAFATLAASDFDVIQLGWNPAPGAGTIDLAIAISHNGNFARGRAGATFTSVVSNVSGAATNGSPVSVSNTLSAGLTATALGGTGWACVLGTLTCTRSDALAGGASYPAITVTVSVAAIAPANVGNSAAVSGGGDANAANNTVTDSVSVVSGFPVSIYLLLD